MAENTYVTELEVSISANIEELKEELAIAEKLLHGVGAETETAAKDTTESFAKMGKGTRQASTAVIDFSRVIQDSPYGLIGVANNIEQLTTSLSNLSKTSGSAGSKLKALGSAFLGPAGLVLAVSAVTAGLQIFGDKLFGVSKQVEAFNSSLSTSQASAQAEIVVVNGLVRVANDLSNSLEVRQKAVEELNSKYGDYLGNLTTESVTTERVRKSVDALNKSLLENARVRAAGAALEQILSDKYLEQIELRAKLEKATENATKSLSKLAKENETFASIDTSKPLNQQIKQFKELFSTLGRGARADSFSTQVYVSEIEEVGEALNELKTDIENSLGELSGVIKSGLEDAFEQEIKANTNIDLTQVQTSIQNLASSKALDNLKQELDSTLTLSNYIAPTPSWEETLKLEEMMAVAEQMKALLAQAIGSSLTDTFREIGSALGEGADGFDQIGKRLLASLGGIMTQLGGALITIGIQMAIAKAAFESLNAGAMIAAGAVLVIAGAALSSAFKESGNSIGGGSGTNSGNGSNATDLNPDFGPQDAQVTFEIQGNKLIGVLNNTSNSNGRLGSNLQLR